MKREVSELSRKLERTKSKHHKAIWQAVKRKAERELRHEEAIAARARAKADALALARRATETATAIDKGEKATPHTEERDAPIAIVAKGGHA